MGSIASSPSMSSLPSLPPHKSRYSCRRHFSTACDIRQSILLLDFHRALYSWRTNCDLSPPSSPSFLDYFELWVCFLLFAKYNGDGDKEQVSKCVGVSERRRKAEPCQGWRRIRPSNELLFTKRPPALTTSTELFDLCTCVHRQQQHSATRC